MKRKNYETPSVEVISVSIEKGFAVTTGGSMVEKDPVFGTDLEITSGRNTQSFVDGDTGEWEI